MSVTIKAMKNITSHEKMAQSEACVGKAYFCRDSTGLVAVIFWQRFRLEEIKDDRTFVPRQ